MVVGYNDVFMIISRSRSFGNNRSETPQPGVSNSCVYGYNFGFNLINDICNINQRSCRYLPIQIMYRSFQDATLFASDLARDIIFNEQSALYSSQLLFDLSGLQLLSVLSRGKLDTPIRVIIIMIIATSMNNHLMTLLFIFNSLDDSYLLF